MDREGKCGGGGWKGAGTWRGKERGKKYGYGYEGVNETDIENEKRGKDKQWRGWNRVQPISMPPRLQSFSPFLLVPLWLCPSLLMYRSGRGGGLKRVWSHLKFSLTYCRSQKTGVRHDSFNLAVLSSHRPLGFLCFTPLMVVCFGHTCQAVFDWYVHWSDMWHYETTPLGILFWPENAC